MTQKLLRFTDLVARGIVGNRVTLSRRIKAEGFPPGFLLGPNSRAWPEREVDAWLAQRAEKHTGKAKSNPWKHPKAPDAGAQQ